MFLTIFDQETKNSRCSMQVFDLNAKIFLFLLKNKLKWSYLSLINCMIALFLSNILFSFQNQARTLAQFEKAHLHIFINYCRKIESVDDIKINESDVHVGDC